MPSCYTGCTLADGSWVAIGETYKNDCNTWYVMLLKITGVIIIICLIKYCDLSCIHDS